MLFPMMDKQVFFATVALVVALATGSRAVAAEILDDPGQIDERAAQILQASNALCWEMHKHHRLQPDWLDTYRTAKQIWTQAGQLREALHAGPVAAQMAAEQAIQMNEMLVRVEKTLVKWGDGVRSTEQDQPMVEERDVVVTPGAGVAIDVPFVGVRIRTPRVGIREERQIVRPAFERRRPHPNGHGSKRSLERHLLALRIAVDYLAEDCGVSGPPEAGTTPIGPSIAPPAENVPPEPPQPKPE